jgi:phosphoribosylformylglycinamidine synthase
LPAPELGSLRALADVVRGLVADDVPTGLHDVADGGLGPALVELAVAAGLGLQIAAGVGLDDHIGLFAESADRVVVAVASARVDHVLERAAAAGVGARVLGTAGGGRVVIGPLVDLALDDAVATWRDRLPAAFGAGATH